MWQGSKVLPISALWLVQQSKSPFFLFQPHASESGCWHQTWSPAATGGYKRQPGRLCCCQGRRGRGHAHWEQHRRPHRHPGPAADGNTHARTQAYCVSMYSLYINIRHSTNLSVCLSGCLFLCLSACFSVSGSLRSVCGWTQSYQFGPVSRGFWWRWLSLCRMFWTMVSSSRRSTAEPESFWTRSGCWRSILSRPSHPSRTWR